MSRKSRNRDKNNIQSLPSPVTSQPMRERETFARDIESLRSVEAMKLRQNLVQVWNYEAQAQPERNRGSRSAPLRSAPQVRPRRNLPSVNQMSSQRVPAPVRAELLDGTRLLSCYRRTARKETLFALRHIGKGKSGRNIRKAKWTDKSYLRCK